MKSLWGKGVSGPAHFGLDNIVLEQRKVMAEGADHTILLADVHTLMSRPDDFKLDDVRRRSAYYEAVFGECYGLKVKYLRGSDFQFDPDYFSAALRIASTTLLSHARSALGAAAVAGSTRSELTVGALLYPTLQVLDAAYLGIDCILADEGQKKIYDLGKPGGMLFEQLENLRQHGQRDLRFPVDIRYFGLAVDTKGLPMSQSSVKTRISLHDNSDSLREKVRAMYAPPADQVGDGKRRNALLWNLEYSAIPWIDLPCTLETPNGSVQIDSYAELEAEYLRGNLHPNDMKGFLCDVLTERARKMKDALSSGLTSWIDIDRVRGLK
jgi:tyrosyl-tRNA synthetase